MAHLRQADHWGLVGDGVLEQQLGEVFRELGRRAEAERRFEQAIVLAPRRTAARLGLVDLLPLRGAEAEARKQLLAILEQEPDHRLARRRLARPG